MLQTYSMEHNTSSEAISSIASQAIPGILCNPKVHHRLDVCTVHFVKFNYICPTNAQYVGVMIPP